MESDATESDATASDATLARAAAAGDSAAFDALYHRHRAALHGFVTRQLADAYLAEDVVQECFLVAWRDLGKLRDPQSFRSWLFSIGYRQAASMVTSRARTTPVPLESVASFADDPYATPEALAEQHEAQTLVWTAASGLEPRQRTVLELAVRYELSSREIGEVLGVGRAHAAVLVHRARAALRIAIDTLLITRQRGRCLGLQRLVGTPISGQPRKFDARQRSSVDHHVRRCPECRRFSTRVASVATAMFLIAPSGKQASLSLAAASLKLGAVAVVAGAAVATYAYAFDSPEPKAPLTSAPSSAPSSASPAVSPEPTPTPSLAPSPSTSPSPSKTSPEEQMVAIINQRRAEAGCGAVRSDERLAKAAEGHSADMAANSYFSHTSQDGRSPWDRAKAAGYSTPSAENIAAGNAGAEATMKQLMNSPGHRANILNCQHKAVGVGRASGGPYRYYWTQLFGSR